MFLLHTAAPLTLLLSTVNASPSKHLQWADTKFLFTFGDSYTTDGFNISAGVDSPVPGFTSSNGPNWVQSLGSEYNVTDTKVFNLASGGATVDSAMIPPYLSTVLSIVDQVGQFNEYLKPKPVGAQWNSSNSLFAIWIGINDVGNSFGWTNVTFPSFFDSVIHRLETQVDALYEGGARSFLLLTVPPTDRAPLWFQQGSKISHRVKTRNAEFNALLRRMAAHLGSSHHDISVRVFDTQPIFNTLLDHADIFKFSNSTGWCTSYENGTPSTTTQISPCAPVSSYFWLNSLHPLYVVHNILAHGISTFLSA